MSQKSFACFDIDGTLIRWQLYHAVVDKLAKLGLLGENAHDKVHKARMIWKRREHRDAFIQYERELINVYEESLPNLKPATFDEVVKKVADEYKLQVYAYTRELINKCKKDGYVLLAISGSHQELVEHVAKQFGFNECVGTTYERKNGKFSGEKYVVSIDKNKMLLELIKKYNLTTKNSIAVGDSKGDISMLEIVDNPIAFNPDRQLFEAAKKNSWKVVIERKNMIYELESKNGKFILAKTN